MTIEITHLANGFTVATDAMAHVETASVGVWVGSGTRNERPEWNGIAHMLEHMAFKGTARRSAQDIAEEIEAVGGQLNAYTSREHTAYYAKVLAGDLPLAVDILADILQHSAFDAAELERERTVILQEIGQANDTPDDIVFDYFQAAAFPDQAMGRSVLGTNETVKAMGRATLFDHLRAEYGPERAILAAAGRLEHAQVVDMAQRLFGAMARTAVAPSVPEPARYGSGEKREARALEQLHLVLGFEGVAVADRDYYSASALSVLLGGGMSSRLFQEVREKRGLAYSIYAYSSSYLDCGLFGIYAGTGEASVPELIAVTAGEIISVTARVGADELARARAQLKATTLMALESTGARCERLAQNLMSFGRIVPIAEIVERIEAVDEAAIASTARRIFRRPVSIAAVGPLATLDSLAGIQARFA